MDRQPPAVHIVGFLAQEIEQLGVAHGDQEVKAVIGIAHNEEQRRPAVAQGVQLQLIVGGDLPQLGNIERGKPCPAGNQNRLGGFASGQFIFGILAHCKVVGVPFLQLVEHQVHGVFEFLIVLPDLHAVYHFDEGGEILFLHRGLVVDVADERAVQE